MAGSDGHEGSNAPGRMAQRRSGLGIYIVGAVISLAFAGGGVFAKYYMDRFTRDTRNDARRVFYQSLGENGRILMDYDEHLDGLSDDELTKLSKERWIIRAPYDLPTNGER